MTTPSLLVVLISHERPSHLACLLHHLCHVRHLEHISLAIVDNSVVSADSISRLAGKYALPNISSPGISQRQNFLAALDYAQRSDATHFMLVHDDDLLLPGSLSQLSVELQSSRLHYLSSVVVDDRTFDTDLLPSTQIFLSTLLDSAVPWRLPSFPSWIYPVAEHVFHALRSGILLHPLGKYTDFYLVHQVCMTCKCDPSPISPNTLLYVTRLHGGNDSQTISLPDYLRLYNYSLAGRLTSQIHPKTIFFGLRMIIFMAYRRISCTLLPILHAAARLATHAK